MPCPFYKMDLCNAIKDVRLARLYTSRQRCMFEYSSCSIYIAQGDRGRQTVAAQQDGGQPLTRGAGSNASQTTLGGDHAAGSQPAPQPQAAEAVDALEALEVECEFFYSGSCRAMGRRLTRYEAQRCSEHYEICPIREKALRKQVA